MTERIVDVISAIAPGIIVGIVLAAWNRKQKRRDNKSKAEAENQFENELMRIDLEVASAQLAYAVAMAYKRGTPNGEMEVAIARYEKAMEKFRRFERKQMARNCE